MTKENSFNKNIYTVPIEELRTDMILAKDVVNKWGGVLLSKGAVISMVNFRRLKSNGIQSVDIIGDTIELKKPILFNEKDIVSSRIPVIEKEEFKEFERNYAEKTEEIKNSLLAIGDGEAIQLDKLYELTDGVMSKLHCKSDVFTYLNYLKTTDEHTFTHSNNVALLCNLFGSWIGLPQQQLMHLTTAGVLHDLGKIKVDLEILNKKGKLTPDEFEHIKKHPLLGYDLLESQNIPREIKLAALMHHEKIDGTGYPLRIKSDKISNYAKIVAICDIYDAMTANRVYRAKLCPFEVIRQFERQSFGTLDTEYLLIFLQNITFTYLGSWVRLSDNREAEIVFINNNNLSRPMVQTAEKEIIDLNYRKDLNIEFLV